MFVGKKNNSQKWFCSLFWCHIIPNRTFFYCAQSHFLVVYKTIFLLLLLLLSFSIRSLRICSRPLTFRCSYFSFVQFIIELMLWALAFISGFFCCYVSYSICFAPVSQVFIGTVSGMCLVPYAKQQTERLVWHHWIATLNRFSCFLINSKKYKCIQTWILYFILKEWKKRKKASGQWKTLRHYIEIVSDAIYQRFFLPIEVEFRSLWENHYHVYKFQRNTSRVIRTH